MGYGKESSMFYVQCSMLTTTFGVIPAWSSSPVIPAWSSSPVIPAWSWRESTRGVIPDFFCRGSIPSGHPRFFCRGSRIIKCIWMPDHKGTWIPARRSREWHFFILLGDIFFYWGLAKIVSHSMGFPTSVIPDFFPPLSSPIFSVGDPFLFLWALDRP